MAMQLAVFLILVLLGILDIASGSSIEHLALRNSYLLGANESLSLTVYFNPHSDYYTFMVCDQTRGNNCDITECSGTMSYTLSNSTQVVAASTTSSCYSSLIFMPTRQSSFTLSAKCLTPSCSSSGKALNSCRYFTPSKKDAVNSGGIAGIVIALVFICGIAAWCSCRASSGDMNHRNANAVFPAYAPQYAAPMYPQQYGPPQTVASPVGTTGQRQQFEPAMAYAVPLPQQMSTAQVIQVGQASVR